jgi:hypothetical protein
MKCLRLLLILLAVIAMGTVANAGTEVSNCVAPIIFGI